MIRFNPDDLKVAAVAARNFQPNYKRSIWDSAGNPCPAQAMANQTGLYQFTPMCDLLWHAAGMPTEVENERWPYDGLKYQFGSVTLYSEDSKYGRQVWWLQNELARDPQLIAGVIDSIIVCSDPTWSSLVAVEPAPVAQLERAAVS